MSGTDPLSTDPGMTQEIDIWDEKGKYIGHHDGQKIPDNLKIPSYWLACQGKNNYSRYADSGTWSFQGDGNLKFKDLISKLRNSEPKSSPVTWSKTKKEYSVKEILAISDAEEPNFEPADVKSAQTKPVVDTNSAVGSLSHSQSKKDNLGGRDVSPGHLSRVEGSSRPDFPSAESAGEDSASKQNSRESVDRDLLKELLCDLGAKSRKNLEIIKREIKQCQEMIDKVRESVNNASHEMVDTVNETGNNASVKLKNVENLAQKQAKATERNFAEAKWTVVVVGVILAAIVLVGAVLSNPDLLPWANAPRPIATKDLQKSAEYITNEVDVQVKSSGRDMANKIDMLRKESVDLLGEIKKLININRAYSGQGPGQLTDDGAALKEVKGLIMGILEALKARGETESKWGEVNDRERKRLENDLVSKLEGLRDEVAKTIGEVGSESKAASDSVTNRIDVVMKKIDEVGQETRKASGNVEKAITVRLGDIEKERIKKAEELSGRLARLEASLHLPTTEELYSVAIVVDGGQELANYGDRPVRQAVIDAVSQAVRQTEARPIGVIWNRGADPVVIEMLDRHFIENIAEIKSRLSEGLIATPGERSDWSVGLERALGLLALQESPRRRVVQISFAESAETTSPEREAKLAETARKHKIEVWTIELMTPGSIPAKGFVDAALKSGGQFVSVPVSERSAQDGAVISFTGRLRSILLDALSLPELMEPPR